MTAPRPVDRLAEQLVLRHGVLTQVRQDQMGRAAATTLLRAPAGPVLVPRRLDASVREALGRARLQLLEDDAAPPSELLQAPSAVTVATLAVAETGDVVVEHAPGKGRRAGLTAPRFQVLLLAASDIVSSLEEGLVRLSSALTAGTPLTWLSGPGEDPEAVDEDAFPPPRRLHVVVGR